LLPYFYVSRENAILSAIPPLIVRASSELSNGANHTLRLNRSHIP
jgi:hypothetical protein